MRRRRPNVFANDVLLLSSWVGLFLVWNEDFCNGKLFAHDIALLKLKQKVYLSVFL